MGLYLLQPVLDVIKRALLRAIIDKNDAHGAFVVSLGDCAEALLPRSVPHLKLHSLVLHIDSFYLKVDANGGHVTCREVVFRKSKQDAALSNGGVPDYDEFYEVVVLFLACLHFFFF